MPFLFLAPRAFFSYFFMAFCSFLNNLCTVMDSYFNLPAAKHFFPWLVIIIDEFIPGAQSFWCFFSILYIVSLPFFVFHIIINQPSFS
jgi:hypothetical protein